MCVYREGDQGESGRDLLRPAGRQAGRRTDRQTDRQTESGKDLGMEVLESADLLAHLEVV